MLQLNIYKNKISVAVIFSFLVYIFFTNEVSQLVATSLLQAVDIYLFIYL